MSDADTGWGDTTVLRADVLVELQRLKQRPGRELQVHGSWQLVQALHGSGLFDRYRLLVFPTVVGSGKRAFSAGTTPSGFTVVERSATAAGASALTLEPIPFGAGSFVVKAGHESTT